MKYLFVVAVVLFLIGCVAAERQYKEDLSPTKHDHKIPKGA